MNFFGHVARRRQHLRTTLSSAHSFQALEESCAPSYVHSNLAAAWVAWYRLFRSARYFRRYGSGPQVLDFGAGTGELAQLLPTGTQYSFAEETDFLANYIAAHVSGSVRVGGDALPVAAYDGVFALDSLEHNADPVPLLAALHRSLKPTGIFILSGPTESWVYRLGRMLAGFSGHYHETNIYRLETLAEALFERVAVARVPWFTPLFRITVWRPK